MTLRIHFTAEDLARTTVASEPDPLWEALLSLHMLQVSDGPTQFGFWRRRIRKELSRAAAGLLVPLAPPRGFYSPDFLTPAGLRSGSFEEALDTMLSTPRQRIRNDLARFASREPASAWTRQLAEGRRDAVRRLGTAMRAYHQSALAPYWSRIRAQVRTDHRQGADRLAAGGLDALMAGIHPRVRWHRPVLHVLDFPDEDLRLNGRGLRLQSSYFCWRVPTKLYDHELRPVLVYPLRHDPGPLRPAGDPVPPSLAALLGRTRATALELTLDGCTTTEISLRCQISLAAASHQATVLRNAGLIGSRRDGKTVVHEVSPLGAALLNGGDPADGDTDPHDRPGVPPPRTGGRP